MLIFLLQYTRRRIQGDSLNFYAGTLNEHRSSSLGALQVLLQHRSGQLSLLPASSSCRPPSPPVVVPPLTPLSLTNHRRLERLYHQTAYGGGLSGLNGEMEGDQPFDYYDPLWDDSRDDNSWVYTPPPYWINHAGI